MLFSFRSSNGSLSLVEVSQITFNPDEFYLTLHSFRPIYFDCSQIRYDQICNELFLYGRSDIRDLVQLYSLPY